MKKRMVRKIVLGAVGLVIMLLLAACSGVGTTSTAGTPTSLSGTITAVNAANHSVTISANGQSYTITGLSDQAVQVLQTQIGKTYTIQVSQNSDGSFSITTGTLPVPDLNNTGGTPSANVVPGSIELTGPIQSVSSSSLTVKLPDNSTLTMALNASTDQSDLNGAQLSNGQFVAVEANTNPDGSFTASKVKTAEANSDDANTVTFRGVALQPVSTNNALHFRVGTQNYSYAVNSSTQLDDFNGNVHTITSGTPVKVEVQFTGTTGTVTKVSDPNN